MCKKLTSLFIVMLAINGVLVAQVERVQEQGPGISARLQHEINITKDPALGIVPRGRLVEAYAQRQQRLQQLAGRAPLFTWTERGPNSDATGPSNGNTRPGNGVTSGRVRAIWEDLADATRKTVWVGGIDGGLWKTTDITLSPATWTPVNDFLGNLAVASICQDPTDFNIMYFGTGEKAINADAVRGAGLWRSTDHGITWSLMPGSANLWNVSKVVCDASGNLYVSCNSISNTQGVQRYTKSTATWANITPSGLDARVPDMELSSTGRLHIVCGYYNTAAASSGYRYTDNPATVTSTTWSSTTVPFTAQYNVELACSGNTIFALPSNSAWGVTTIYKSTNGGVSWAATGTTPAFTSGQAWYCMAAAIDPNNANNVIVGSLDCYKTTNGGSTWTKISEWVGTTGQYVHADQQIITWNSNNQVLVGSDGGVHISTNGGTSFTDRNTGLRLKQFYAVAIHPSSTNYFLAGAQDNGVHQLNSAGLGSSVEVTGGDGAFVHIDQNQPLFQWGAYVYNQYRRSTNGGSSWTSVNFSSTAGRFINPTDYDDVNNIMYCSGAANAFVRWNNPQSGATFTSVSMTALSSTTVSAVKVSPYTNNTVFFGGGGSGLLPRLIRATNANATPTFTSIISAGMQTSGTNISCVELGTDENNIIVSFSNYGINNLWVTNNGGSTWTAIDGNLPDMPVRWAMFYPGDNTKAIIATETGVWQTELINGASTLWDPETGFPNVRTDMLQYRSSDQTLAAATHGRGLFTTTLSAAPGCGTVSGLASSSVSTTGATISWTALGGALNYDVDYKLASSGTWTNAATATAATSVNLAGLTENSLYDWRVRANCTGATGAYTAAQFTTLSSVPTCGTVAGLTSSAISTSAATVSWTALSGALNYDVDYKPAASGTWTNAATGTTAISVNLGGLSAGTLYDWRVRANCTGATGAYAQAQFTTTAVVTCPGPLDVSTNGTASGAATIPFNTDVKGLISPSGDNDYYKFVITTGGTATITLTTLPGDYDIRLYSSNGTTQLAISQNGGTTAETISRTYTAGTYYIRVYGYLNANNATQCYTLRVALGTATAAGGSTVNTGMEKPVLALFPNPARQRLSVYVANFDKQKVIEIFNISGQRVMLLKEIENNLSLDVSKLTGGIYLLRVSSTDGTLVSQDKFIKE
ncbi:MAG: fibronectin type III domain-containing protein [Sphingobacteriales bacterium]|nr:fibronectin type III domain-containing protein [Sphingobacteriales bacterium]